MWTYEQSKGKLSHNGVFVATGYSGFGEGKNNPSKQAEQGVGPIPQGLWHIGAPFDSPDHGPYVLRLSPAPETMTFGRSGFLIHGDSLEHPGLASRGCIIMPRNIREQIHNSNDGSITVIA